MPADGRVELMFSFAGGSQRTDVEGGDLCHITAHSFILGARGQGYLLEHVAAPVYVVARFKPGGFAAFARLPVAELTDVYVELDCLWDTPAVRRLEERLYAAPSPEAQVAMLETALLGRLAPPDHLDALLYAVRRLEAAPSALAIPALAGEINLSQKHMERLFARYIGFRPSLFARVARFQAALYTAVVRPGLTLSQLALDAGYYDQAHFTRDFRAFAGAAPLQFLSASHDFVQISTPAQVVDFLQDPRPALAYDERINRD
jgi:AraC-like DNA-binding protein